MAFRRGLLWLLVCALAAVQTLGLAHSVAHGVRSASAQAIVAVTAAAEADSYRGWASGLFAGHDDDAGCLLYDQLSHGGCVPAPVAASLPAVPPVFLAQWFQAEFLASWAALFDARGPPTIR